MPLRTYLDVNIYDKDVLDVVITEKDLIAIDLNVLDIIQDRNWVVSTIRSTLVRNETPTKVNATDFETDYGFVAGSVEVYYNGLKEKSITEVGNQKIRFPYDTITGDTIEVSYLRTTE